MEPPHAYWADHEHSDENLNLLFTIHCRQATEPSPPHRVDNNDHNHSDEQLNLTYATVRQQRSFYPDSSLSSFSPPDPGSFSPSLFRRRARVLARGKRRLRVINTTPPPPPPPTPESTPLLFFGEDLRAQEEMQREMELSSGWSASSEASTVSVARGQRAVRSPSPWPPLERGRTNFYARYLRRARNCIGEAVIAIGDKIGQIGELAGVGNGAGGLDGGAAGDAEMGFWERAKRKLFRVDRPVRLKKAKVRFPLD